jgi:hypothetical protein
LLEKRQLLKKKKEAVEKAVMILLPVESISGRISIQRIIIIKMLSLFRSPIKNSRI